jgi:hypothetical protein
MTTAKDTIMKLSDDIYVLSLLECILEQIIENPSHKRKELISCISAYLVITQKYTLESIWYRRSSLILQVPNTNLNFKFVMDIYLDQNDVFRYNVFINCIEDPLLSNKIIYDTVVDIFMKTDILDNQFAQRENIIDVYQNHCQY